MSDLIELRHKTSSQGLSITSAEYNKLVKLNKQGWSKPQSEAEFLSKLHYVRDGCAKGKITPEELKAHEAGLILNWGYRLKL